METANFLTWLLFFGLISGIGIGAMIYAYRGKGSISVLFTKFISTSSSITSEAEVDFQQGCEAFQKGNYQQAINKFTEALKNNSTIAEAYHNRGLAFANLRQDDESVENLLQAGELYIEQKNQDAMMILKKNLELLKARKEASAATGKLKVKS
ncbi:MAG: tetratricopeptide repeat protein [Okeania sp. SIO3C4]|nr:tetratricopeptide repeat protein [Okeania sp. SIO3B3]NER04458.1 tetratricopeptide repeat protein [Okeania sp. SIO3C4]